MRKEVRILLNDMIDRFIFYIDSEIKTNLEAYRDTNLEYWNGRYCQAKEIRRKLTEAKINLKK